MAVFLLPDDPLASPDPSASRSRAPTAMTASAVISTEVVPDGDPAHLMTRFARLRADAPLVPRPAVSARFEPYVQHAPGPARCVLAAGAAGPLGGDHYTLHVDVGTGSTLVLREASATVALPGPHGERSVFRFLVSVGTNATLIWDPEPVIAARGCDHYQHVEITLAQGARLFYREELITGRHGEGPGNLMSHLEVRYGLAPLLVQNIALGTRHKDWDSPAVLGGHRAAGSLLIVDPDGAPGPASQTLSTHAVAYHLDDCAAVAMAVGPHSLAVRKSLDAYLAGLDPPWGNPSETGWYPIPR